MSGGWLVVAAEGQDGVEAAESQRVGDGDLRSGLTGMAGDDVEVEVGIDRSNAGGGGKTGLVQGEDGGEGFERAGGSDGVAVEALGSGDGNAGGAGAEDLVESVGFDGVVDLGPGAVSVDVIDVLRGEVRVGECLADGDGSAGGIGLSDVAGVGGHAEAYNLSVDGCAAGLRGGESLKGERGSSFAEGHAVAVDGEGTAGGGRDDADAVPGAEKAKAERRFVAAGNGRLNHSGADHVEGHADGMVGGGAGGGDGEDRPGDAEIDGDLADAGRGHGAGDGEGVDAGVAGVELGGLGLDGGAPAVAAA